MDLVKCDLMREMQRNSDCRMVTRFLVESAMPKPPKCTIWALCVHVDCSRVFS
jgi:hypothetical protein